MKRLLRWAALAALALALVTGLTACEDEDVALVKDFVQDWARSKDIDPSTPSGIANIGARTLFGTSTGDEVADAAIDAGSVVKGIQDADALVDKGAQSGNVGDIDKGINMRPQDFTYRNTRGVTLMRTKADFDGAKKDFDNADRLAAQQGERAKELNLRNRLEQEKGLIDPKNSKANPFNAQYCADAQAYLTLTGDAKYFSAFCGTPAR